MIQKMHVQTKMATKRICRLLDLEEEEDEDSFMFQLFLGAFIVSKQQRRKHKYWIHPLLLKRKTHRSYHHLVQELRLHSNKFQEYFRMSIEKFEELLNLVGPLLQKHPRNREPISPEQRFSICLRLTFNYCSERPLLTKKLWNLLHNCQTEKRECPWTGCNFFLLS